MAIPTSILGKTHPGLVMQALPASLLRLVRGAGLALVCLGCSGQAYAALQLNSATLSVAAPAQGPAAVVYVMGGGTITAAVNGSTVGTTNWQATSWQVGAGAATCANHTNFNSNNATTTISINITAPAAAGTYDASFIAYSDNACTTNASNTLTLPVSVVVDNTAPGAASIVLANANPTSAASVSWTVTFSESVVGLTAGNFTLVQGGGLSGAAISSITEASGTGANTVWTVTASTGAGSGTLGLDLTNAAGITDRAGNLLTGVPVTGGVYTVFGSTAFTTLPTSPTLCVNDPGIGTVAWTGLTNVGAKDNVYARASVINGQVTNYLKCTGYNFNIPANAIINGITAGVWRYSRRTISDQAMQLVKANLVQPTNLATLTRFPTRNTQVLYGGATNLWGNTWTPAEINDPGFGAAFAAVRGAFATSDTAFVDNMPITIDYSVPSGPDHIQITHDGNALTCSPDVVTITACADAACTILYTAGGVNVTLTPGGQTFTIDATGVNGAATVQQSTAGAATLGATSAPATLNAATCLNTATGTASCAMTFSDSGFVVTVPNHASCSNTTATIEAVQTAPGTGRCIPAYQNVTRAVNLYSSYTSPASGTQAITASTGAVSTTAPGSAHNLAFDATGTATITLSYPDAGQLTLTAGDTAPTGKAMSGSGAFVVAPASFAFSAIPAAPLMAGQAFNATVTAMNACATPAATPNFNGTVALTSSNPQPGPGNATAINTNLSGFSNGVASASLVWGEVGTIDLNASLTGYLGWTPTAPATWLVNSTRTGVGRFQPAYFDTAVTPGCATFTYAGSTAPAKAGQAFKVTVTANKAGGGVTANYAGANAYLTTLSNAGATTGLAGNTIAAASFANGVGSANVTYAVATPETPPLTLAMRATDADPSPVSSSGHAEGAADIRSGRAKLVNAHGSELLTLHVPFRTEYWSNNGWMLNSADTCSGDVTLGAGNAVSVTLSSPPASCVQDSGNPGLSGAGCAAAGPAAQRFKEGATPGTGFVGDFNLWLSAPGAGNNGVVTVIGNVPAWLQYAWGGAAVANPAARATFGVYKGNNEFIYLRESY